MPAAQGQDVACTRCEFFDDHVAKPDADEGLCRSDPPVTQPSADEHGLWPVVPSKDRCGHLSIDALAAGSADRDDPASP